MQQKQVIQKDESTPVVKAKNQFQMELEKAAARNTEETPKESKE